MATSQLRITIPAQIQDLLISKSDKYGLSMSAYVRNLIINDVKETGIHMFDMSSKTEKIATKALKDHTEGKTHDIENIEDFLESV
ncbi:hypothetical protein COU87_02430 [Candidatus Roizmanbacteria bacterium CG10_big_fil_rev_8_21_14_0_10_39_12]|uniref:Uncharacterized protein n=1 Tax=Candidatus Roizmanbacteria bacterium CG10_big_fil_rev_8_21_14_0_10_39_12 TaxID=1974852 RepID=A0A2M8KPK3_9BACT|nr:MAG: hypothetical protein COU87_02430 [Candidatus Roizmanbacteria bacterium CG10_big_fil_rev_8_21_14_0_10_39_12]